MDSREIVQRTLDYEDPERVARSFGDSDLLSVSSSAKTHATEWVEVGQGDWERIDEWGNTWRRIDPTSKCEVFRGALDDLSGLSSYEFPDFSKSEDYDVVRKSREENPAIWLMGHMPGFAFNIARKMCRLEQYLINIMVDRVQIHELHDRIDSLLEDMIRNYAAAGVDSVMFPEDWGTQTQTLISPPLWREEFYPRFRKLCGIAHECGIKVFMHSCGKIEAIVPGLIDAGVDLLQFDQPDLHGIDTLAEYQLIKKVTFWCPVDIQFTLQTRNENTIKNKVQEMLDKLWKGRGGFVAGYYTDNPSIGLDPKWQDLACEAFLDSGIRTNYETAHEPNLL